MAVFVSIWTKVKGFGMEKDETCGKFIGTNLVIFCYKEFTKFALCKSISQLEATFTVYSDPIAGRGKYQILIMPKNTLRM